MKLFTSQGAFGRVMAWITGLAIVAGGLSFLPSPFGLAGAFASPPVPAVKAVGPVKLAALPPLEAYEPLLRRPLFNPARVPDPVLPAATVAAAAPAASSLGDLGQYRVVGIAGDSQTRIALVRKGEGDVRTLKPGDSLDGWIVRAINERGVSISGGGRTEILAIPRASNAAPTR
jgi:hypothetical protein